MSERGASRILAVNRRSNSAAKSQSTSPWQGLARGSAQEGIGKRGSEADPHSEITLAEQGTVMTVHF